MEYASIEREMHIDASPDVVYEVISSPEHINEWWGTTSTSFEAVAGSSGEIAWGSIKGPDTIVEQLTVVEADPPRRFAFRWVYPAGAVAAPGNSLLATFDLAPAGEGTLLRVTETGFREMGWEAAVLEQAYNDHCAGWDHHLPHLVDFANKLAVRR